MSAMKAKEEEVNCIKLTPAIANIVENLTRPLIIAANGGK